MIIDSINTVMKKLIFIFVLQVVCNFQSTVAVAQEDKNYKKIFTKAEEYFVNENYQAGLILYLRLDSIQKANTNINFKIGMCYLNSPTYKTKAIPYLQEAVKDVSEAYKELSMKEKHAPVSAYYYLGKAYHLNNEFDKAIEWYGKYKTELLKNEKKNLADIEEMDHDIEQCNNGKELIKKPKNIVVTNLGEGVNSKYPEYSPVVSLDEETLIFTSRREGGMSDYKLPDGQYLEDIYISTYKDDKWGKASLISPNINSMACEASINLSADGKNLLVYKDDNGDGNIYVSELKGNEWGVPEYEISPINSNAWETHACFSSDNRVLYFVSDRLGGYGGRDIYKCLRLPNGKWGPAQNLGDVINTKYDEDGVFIHPDGQQIFFASKGHNSMGGFDIFTSIINDENGFWSTPVNYGYPVNTSDDDVFLVTSPDGRRAFFSSDKEGGYGQTDIYMIKFPDFEPRDITILVGKVINNSTEDISDNKIVFVSLRTGDTTQVLNMNSASGKFGANLPVGSNYQANFYINGQRVYSEVMESPKGLGYTVLRRDIPYNGRNTVDTAVVINKPRPVVAVDTVKKLIDHTVKVDRSLKEDTAVVVDKTPPEVHEQLRKEEVVAKKDTVKAVKKTLPICDPKRAVFQMNFRYNRKDIDSNSKEFTNLINELSNCILTNAGFTIYIESSASTVPTRTFKTNENLANSRAENAKDKMIKALVKKGIKESSIVFAAPVAKVQGPEYHKDAQKNRGVYEQFQYVKITGK